MSNKNGRPTGSYSGEFNGEQVNSEIGFLLGSTRTARGLGLKSVGAALGVSAQFISNIEHGHAPLPSKYVATLASLLNLDQSLLAGLALRQTKVYKDFHKVV